MGSPAASFHRLAFTVVAFEHVPDASPNREVPIVTQVEPSLGWIPVGRDFAVENEILWKIRQRLTSAR